MMETNSEILNGLVQEALDMYHERAGTRSELTAEQAAHSVVIFAAARSRITNGEIREVLHLIIRRVTNAITEEIAARGVRFRTRFDA